MPGTVTPKRTMVGLFASLGNIVGGFLFSGQNFPGILDFPWDKRRFQCDIVGHIDDLKELLNIQFLAPDIVGIDAHKISAGDGDAALLQHILLVGNIDAVDLRFMGGAFHLVNGIAAIFAAVR